MVFRLQRPRLLTSALVMVAAICAIGLIGFALKPLPLWDLHVHLDGAAAWTHGQDPYLEAIHDPSAGARPGSGFVYPPYTLPFFAALSSLGEFALDLWQLAQLAALAWLVWNLATPRSPKRLAALTIMAVAFYPVITNLVLGQVGLLMVAALWTAMLLSRRRGLASGTMLALAALFKVFPLVLIVGLVIRRQWGAGLAAAAAMVAVVGGTMPWVGRYWSEYLQSVLFAKAATVSTYGDAQSIASTAVRSFPQSPSAAHVGGLFAATGILIAVFVVAATVAKRNPALAWALPMAALPLTMPHAWQHYYVLALPLLWMIATAGIEAHDLRLMGAAAIAFVFLSPLALTVDYWAAPIIRVLGPAQGLYLNGSVIGGAVLIVAGGWLASRQRREPEPAVTHVEPRAA